MNQLTTGNVKTVLLKFALPFLLASCLQALYGAADLLVVGQFSNSAAVSAVATGSQFMQTITGIILGISTGGTVLIAKCIGEKNEEGTAKAIGTLSLLFILIALILTPLILIFTQPITHLLHTPIEAQTFTMQYITTCAIGIPFIVGYNAVSAIFRGLGDSKTPVYFVLIACVINILVDLILVGGFNFGAIGAALATISSQAISFIMALIYIKKHGLHVPIHKSHFKLHLESAKYILIVGLPLAAQDALVNTSFLIITAVVNQMGVIASAAVGVVEKIIIFLMLPPTAFGSAVSAMTAQNIGANEHERTKQVLRYGILYALVFGISATVYCQFAPETLTSLFSKDIEVIQNASLYLKSYSFDCIMVSFVFCLNGYFSGLGKSTISLIHSLIATFGFRIPLTIWMSQMANITLYELGLAFPISTLVSIIICFGYLLWINKKESKI